MLPSTEARPIATLPSSPNPSARSWTPARRGFALDTQASEELSVGWSLVVVAGFSLVVLIGATHHEMWRDEVRAWSIATAGSSFATLLHNLRNEGHPVLWYVLLRTGSLLTGNSRLVLPVTSAIVALAAVWIFIRCAPFPVWMRVIFPFGYFPLYEYSVMARNYGISMLLMFAICALWSQRWRRPLIIGGLLALLAQTNVHSSILVGAFMLAWVIDALRSQTRLGSSVEAVRPARLVAGFLPAGMGVVICFVITRPDSTSLASRTVGATPRMLLHATALGFLHAPAFLRSGFFPFPGLEVGPVPNWATAIVLLLVAWLLRRRLPLLVAYVVAVSELVGLFAAVYPGDVRHQGLLFVFVIALFWIAQLDAGKDDPANLRGRRGYLVTGIFAVLLLFQAASGLRAIIREVRHEQSAAPALARFIGMHPEYRRVVIMAEPDYLLETLPYYTPNALYVAREGKFARWTHFTTANRISLTLSQLLDSADSIRDLTRRPVLLIFGRGNPYADLRASFSTFRSTRLFSWTPSERERLLRSAEYMGYLPNDWGDEHYHVFVLPVSPPAAGGRASL